LEVGVKLPAARVAQAPLQLAGVVAAVVLAAVVNVLGARHFSRWDWTKDKRWSLSPATLETLGSLEQRVDVWAIAGPGDPLEQSLRQLLKSYEAASRRVEVHWINPDRDAVQLVDLQRRFGLEAGRTEDGRVATDAIVIVASGDKHWFLTPADMFEPTDEVRVKPREERSLTQAFRSVLGGERAKLCFTVGHSELSLEAGKDAREWLGRVRDLFQKSNYDLESVDTTAPNAHEPFAGCTAVVIAGPRAPFGRDEANRLRTWLLEGGSLLLAAGPVEANTDTGMAALGLDDALSPFGIALDDDLVHELSSSVAIPDTHGEGFFATVRPHPVTASLVASAPDSHPPRVALFFSRSLRHVSPPGAAWASDLLATTEGAYAKKSLVGAAAWTDAPAREPQDAGGPFVLAMAAERPGALPGQAHGPRVVVVGSRFALAEDNWTQPRALHGTAFLVDSAVSWLTARATVVDVPDRAEVAAGIQVSEQGREEVRRYVLLLMPLAATLLGIAVWAWRRSSEDKPYDPSRKSR
jgi:gliding motility-associatede transport system auxiliary component